VGGHTGGTVAVEESRLFVATAAAGGVEPRALLERAGVPLAALEEPGGRVPRADFDRLVEQAVQLSGDAHLGLHAAERLDAGHRLPDPLHYGLAACATVGDQLAMAARYAPLLHSDAEVGFMDDGPVARLTHDLPASGAVARRHRAERWLGALALLVRRQAGAGVAPLEVWFTHPAPRDRAAHERIFRAPLRFEQDVDALLLPHAVLGVRVRNGDHDLQRVLDAYLATLLPAAQPADLADLVRRRLGEGAQGRRPDVATVAAALALSPRTLQRRLAEDGTGFRRLVRELREDRAREHLSASGLSLSEIAYVLGFADASSFHRAFKRWTGETPRAYRRRAAAALRDGHDGASGHRSGASGQESPVRGV
jgi:AraC-like DNA-binding protein